MKTRLMFEYDKYIKKGRFDIAKRLLHFLQNRRITLDLSDVDYELEKLFTKIGIKCTHINRFGLSMEFKY